MMVSVELLMKMPICEADTLPMFALDRGTGVLNLDNVAWAKKYEGLVSSDPCLEKWESMMVWEIWFSSGTSIHVLDSKCIEGILVPVARPLDVIEQQKYEYDVSSIDYLNNSASTTAERQKVNGKQQKGK